MNRSSAAAAATFLLLLAACKATPAREEPAAPAAVLAPLECPADASVLSVADPFVREVSVATAEAQFASPEAQRLRLQGAGEFCAEVSARGTVLRVGVLVSAGHPLLDGAALYSLLRSQPQWPPLNEAILGGRSSVWLRVPIALRPPAVSAAPTTMPACRKTGAGEFDGVAANALLGSIFFPTEAPARAPKRAQAELLLDQSDRYRVQLLESSGTALYDAAALIALGNFVLSPERPCFPDEMKGGDASLRLVLPIDW